MDTEKEKNDPISESKSNLENSQSKSASRENSIVDLIKKIEADHAKHVAEKTVGEKLDADKTTQSPDSLKVVSLKTDSENKEKAMTDTLGTLPKPQQEAEVKKEVKSEESSKPQEAESKPSSSSGQANLNITLTPEFIQEETEEYKKAAFSDPSKTQTLKLHLRPKDGSLNLDAFGGAEPTKLKDVLINQGGLKSETHAFEPKIMSEQKSESKPTIEPKIAAKSEKKMEETIQSKKQTNLSSSQGNVFGGRLSIEKITPDRSEELTNNNAASTSIIQPKELEEKKTILSGASLFILLVVLFILIAFIIISIITLFSFFK